MNFTIRALKMSVATLAMVLGATAISFAKDQKKQTFPNIKIKNFGQMDDRFYRGGQPDQRDYKDLASLGITTVIDLREDPASYERQAVEAAGMHYTNIPMSDKTYPRSEQIDSFLKLVDNPKTGKFFVHCAGGRHRTGVGRCRSWNDQLRR